MSTFSYVARSPSGERKTGTLVAADAADARAKLAAAGDQPLLVLPASGPSGVPPAVRRWAGIAGLGLVLCAAAFAVFSLLPTKTAPVEVEAAPGPPPVDPTPVPVAAVAPQPREPTPPPAPLQGEAEPRPPEETVPPAPAAPAPAVPPPPVPLPRRTVPAREVPGIRYSPGGRPIARTVVPPPTDEPPPTMELKTGVDRTLNLIANATSGLVPPPPLDLRTPGEDVLQSLNTDIVLLQQDDASLDKAANVAAAKQVLREYIAEGGDMETFVEAYRKGLQAAYEEREALNAQMRELLRGGDLAAAEKFVEQKNAELAVKGIAPLKIPALYYRKP